MNNNLISVNIYVNVIFANSLVNEIAQFFLEM